MVLVHLLHRIHASLDAGGIVAVVEQLTRCSARVIFILSGSGVYSFDTIVSWLKAAGFVNPHRSDFWKAPGSSVVTATKLNT